MTEAISKTIRTDLPEAFLIEGDRELFERIVADQEAFAGDLRPARNWDLAIGGQAGQQYPSSQRRLAPVELDITTNGEYYEHFSSLQRMMDPYVGCVGLTKINSKVAREYHTFLAGIDHLGILPSYFKANGEPRDEASALMVTDLGSIMDINIVTSFLDPNLEKLRILEVGGGYGRLAEAFLHVYGSGSIRYVLVDAVPASLMYSYLYLSNKFPDLRIGFHYNDDPLDMELFHCYIVPSWHFDVSAHKGAFDCCINIQSMQEMNQHHVDYYLRVFDEVIKESCGIIYISNERDYIFRGQWNFPKAWRCLAKTRTPRSWTRDSPTEVFIKEMGSSGNANRLVNTTYALQLEEFDRNLENLSTISSLQHQLRQAQQEGCNCPQDRANVIRPIQNVVKTGARRIVANLYLALHQCRDAFAHLAQAVRTDLPIMFSRRTSRATGDGLFRRIKGHRRR